MSWPVSIGLVCALLRWPVCANFPQKSHNNNNNTTVNRLCCCVASDFRIVFLFQKSVSFSECSLAWRNSVPLSGGLVFRILRSNFRMPILFSECRFWLRKQRSRFRMGFPFPNITFPFQNVICVSECRLHFRSAKAAVCHHRNGL